MAIKNSSVYYRKNSYKRKKLRNILIVSLVVIAIAVVIFLIVGNILKKKSEYVPEKKPSHSISNTEDSSELTTFPKHNVDIKGKALNIKGATLSQFKSQISDLSESGYSAVSLNLSDKQGGLIYRSEVAQKFGYKLSDDTISNLSSFNTSISSAGLSSSAVIWLNSFEEEDHITRSVLQACEAAIICEIIQAGIDDVIIRCPNISEEHIAELTNIAKDVHSINSDATVGIALPGDFIENSQAALLIDNIITSFDFIALDLIADEYDTEDIAESIERALSTEKYYYILRYNMRVLLSAPDTEEDQKIIYSTMESNSIINWQTVS